ncbi:uncharacterized protein LACBIDRAFT_318832 [Laccaria bicolor S238N-H82]|uniref:Predicted protein n=1 Tax=Laccaria bicolor (strain S238N-H82 / ATCC MYA-4686) TaxID=486041 RepID=B0D774_LACBS|nr:uncharacterized protein LACBIDRAFT_318832 [Laccaria bicolor S238N-H82]EDR09601.1 predicted protein [Laccaria bicolor S238N-H82]|eukprot:XP_001879950.1 predicted protein [Laccaria bicolor S238N-H82]
MLSSLSATTDLDSGSLHVEKLGDHPQTCLEAPGNLQGIHIGYGKHFWETTQPNFRFSLPLPISGSTDNLNSPPADHRTLSAAEAVPSGSPSVAHIPSTTYPSPLAATTPSAASHTPLLGPPEAAVSSGTSLTALYAVTTHPYSLNYITSPS